MDDVNFLTINSKWLPFVHECPFSQTGGNHKVYGIRVKMFKKNFFMKSTIFFHRYFFSWGPIIFKF